MVASTAAIGTLMVSTSAIAATVATQGGNGEIAKRMPGQVAKKIAPDVARHAHEGEARDPAGQPPEQVVGGDQRYQDKKGMPHRARDAGA